MKSQYFRFAVLLASALALGGCAGLEQFPSTSTNYVKDLGELDPDYSKALDDIEQAAGDPEKQKRVRNLEIDRRLRVIDLNFSEFRKGLAKENVAVDFGVAVVAVAVGAAGSLVAETASQILSAASGSLAGAQQAYSKAALYDQTLSALLAQMIASRKAVLVKIYEGRDQGVDAYPLSAAVRHLEAYEFAGSLPGAVVATSADAKVKNDEAEDKLAEFRETTFGEDESATRIIKWIWPNGIDGAVNTANSDELRAWIDRDEGIKDLPIQKLLDSEQLKEARERAITDLQIP